MKKMFVSVFVTFSFFLFSCGGGEGGGSYDSMKKKFDNPTGELKNENGRAVAEGLEKKQKGKIPTALTAALSVIEAPVSGQSITCPQPTGTRITCNCEGGGTISFNSGATSSSGPISVKYTYDNCKIGEITIDGTGAIYKSSATAQDFYFTFKGNITYKDGKTESFDLEYYFDGSSKFWYYVEVEGESFIMSGAYDSSSGNGQFSIKSKNGEWSCTVTNHKGQCTSSTGGSVNWE